MEILRFGFFEQKDTEEGASRSEFIDDLLLFGWRGEGLGWNILRSLRYLLWKFFDSDFLTEGNGGKEGCSNPSFAALLPKNYVSKAKLNAKLLRWLRCLL